MQAKNTNDLDELGMFKIGPTETFILPSGMSVTIRERNGEDEDILSKVKSNKDGSAVHKFISAILVDPKLSEQSVAQLPSKDKYYIMLKSRMQSLGNIVSFQWTFQGDDKTAYAFDTDLTELDWDFSDKNYPKPGDKNYNPWRVTPYPIEILDNPIFELSLSSGKKVRMHYLTGVGESKVLGRNEGDLSINDRLRIRNFEVYTGKEWMPIERYNIFTSREMTEIRKGLAEKDSAFELIVQVQSPKTGQVELVSLLGVESFFFPMTP